jgi:hypothetical protein
MGGNPNSNKRIFDQPLSPEGRVFQSWVRGRKPEVQEPHDAAIAA